MLLLCLLLQVNGVAVAVCLFLLTDLGDGVETERHAHCTYEVKAFRSALMRRQAMEEHG